jgi:DNA primase
VAGIHGADGQVTAVHRTYLDPNGHGKAKLIAPKMALGHFGGGAIRLATSQRMLGLAEGIETGLSVMQLFEIPVWVAAGTRFHRVVLPDAVREVTIFPDNGTPGHDAADRAVKLLTHQGRRVYVHYPPAQYGDWNDALIALAKESK